jgi:hypothetical protein
MSIIVLKLCKNENTRKVHATAYESRNQENIALLEEVSKIVWSNSYFLVFFLYTKSCIYIFLGS